MKSQFQSGGENLAREFDMCEVCKLDKQHICNYDCIKRRSDFMFRFFTCPRFIYDNGEQITNAEWISTLLKSDVCSAADELWNQTVLNDGHVDLGDFRKWLESNVEINTNSN